VNSALNSSSSQPFTFSSATEPNTKPNKCKTLEGDEDQPPKVEFTPVVEEGAIYSKRYGPLIV